jgi:hypothetical protein
MFLKVPNDFDNNRPGIQELAFEDFHFMEYL